MAASNRRTLAASGGGGGSEAACEELIGADRTGTASGTGFADGRKRTHPPMGGCATGLCRAVPRHRRSGRGGLLGPELVAVLDDHLELGLGVELAGELGPHRLRRLVE